MVFNQSLCNSNWSTRPADERFWDCSEAAAVATAQRDASQESLAASANLRAVEFDGAPALMGSANVPATFSNYGFGQLCSRIKAPAEYLRSLSAGMATQLIEYGLRRLPKQDLNLYMSVDRSAETPALMIRSATSERYERIFNAQVLGFAKRLEDDGWRAPPGWLPGCEIGAALEARGRTRKAVAADVAVSARVQLGDTIGPAGVYLSDRDCFIFLVHPDRDVTVGAGEQTQHLMRGVIISNSEVGDGALWLRTMLFEGACGNHNLLGVKEVNEFSIRHIGEAQERLGRAQIAFRRYLDSGTGQLIEQIERAKNFQLGATKEQALDELLALAARKKIQATKGQLADALGVAERTPRYGDPLSIWAVAQGLTEISQALPHASARTTLDRAAGRLAAVAF